MAEVIDSFMENQIHDIPLDSVTPENNGHKEKPYCFMLLLAACGAYMGSVGMGSVIGYSSPAIPELKEDNPLLHITQSEGDWFGSLMPVGALFGGPIAGFAVERFGRKPTLIFISIPFTLGYFLIAYSSQYSMLLIGRILTGLGTGLVSMVVPVYISEISPTSIRGQLGTMVQLSITFGIVYSYTVGNFVYWTWLSIACSAWPILLGVFMVFMPETPFWLLKHGHPQEALKSLVFLRSVDWNVNEEFQELGDATQKESLIGKFSFTMLKDPGVYKPLIISFFIMAFQQVCGVNAVIFYAQSIFEHAGSTISPNLCSIFVGLTQFFGTFIATFLMDKAGRKALLLLSGIGMCISLTVFGIYYYLVELKGDSFQDHYGWIPLTSLIVYNLFFAVGFGPIPWILNGELFPLRVKGFATGVATGANWFFAFLITKEFSDMLLTFGSYGTYFFFASCCLCSCIFVYLFLPETKGRKFEDIEKIFNPSICRVILNEDFN